MMRWLPAVALGLVALGSLLLSAAVLVVPSSTFAQEEEGEVDQTIDFGGGPCSGAGRCDRGYGYGYQCCVWDFGASQCNNRNAFDASKARCNIGGEGADRACTNENPGQGFNCDNCRCQQIGKTTSCECRP